MMLIKSDKVAFSFTRCRLYRDNVRLARNYYLNKFSEEFSPYASYDVVRN